MLGSHSARQLEHSPPPARLVTTCRAQHNSQTKQDNKPSNSPPSFPPSLHCAQGPRHATTLKTPAHVACTVCRQTGPLQPIHERSVALTVITELLCVIKLGTTHTTHDKNMLASSSDDTYSTTDRQNTHRCTLCFTHNTLCQVSGHTTHNRKYTHLQCTSRSPHTQTHCLQA